MEIGNGKLPQKGLRAQVSLSGVRVQEVRREVLLRDCFYLAGYYA